MRLNFKQWLENNAAPLSGPQDLPPIPAGCVRATNFTSPNTAQILLSGQPFKYGRGMITSSTDSFSNNDEVWELLTTGKTGPFDRNSFGNDVVLMDVPNMEYRQHANVASSTGTLDNSRVLGVFNRQTSMLTKNANYNPQKQIDQLQVRVPNRFQKGPTVPAPITPAGPTTNASSAGDDVW